MVVELERERELEQELELERELEQERERELEQERERELEQEREQELEQELEQEQEQELELERERERELEQEREREREQESLVYRVMETETTNNQPFFQKGDTVVYLHEGDFVRFKKGSYKGWGRVRKFESEKYRFGVKNLNKLLFNKWRACPLEDIDELEVINVQEREVIDFFDFLEDFQEHTNILLEAKHKTCRRCEDGW